MRYRPLRDPLFVVCVAVYFVNRWLVKPRTSNAFVHNHLNDLICIPFWVPILIAFTTAIGLRGNDGRPRADEILIPLLVWSVVFELILPRMALFKGKTVADPVDILYYALGALFAAAVWGWQYPRRKARE